MLLIMKAPSSSTISTTAGSSQGKLLIRISSHRPNADARA